MNFNSLRKEITSNNASVKELVNDIYAKIDTDQPSATYWFGPFITKRSLEENMSSFINDLSEEGSKNIKQSLVRCKKEEPLTV